MSKIKEEFHQLIDEMDDDRLLKVLFEMFKNNSAKQLEELSDYDKKILFDSFTQAQNDQVITYVELKKQVDQWLGR